MPRGGVDEKRFVQLTCVQNRSSENPNLRGLDEAPQAVGGVRGPRISSAESGREARRVANGSSARARCRGHELSAMKILQIENLIRFTIRLVTSPLDLRGSADDVRIEETTHTARAVDYHETGVGGSRKPFPIRASSVEGDHAFVNGAV